MYLIIYSHPAKASSPYYSNVAGILVWNFVYVWQYQNIFVKIFKSLKTKKVFWLMLISFLTWMDPEIKRRKQPVITTDTVLFLLSGLVRSLHSSYRMFSILKVHLVCYSMCQCVKSDLHITLSPWTVQRNQVQEVQAVRKKISFV